VQDLVGRLCRFGPEDPRVGKLRYQLLTAWAGTLADAAEAAHAVFVVHEFRTDDRPADKSRVITAELSDSADAVLGCEIPTADAVPWCVELPRVREVPARLYLAHVVTDLRGDALANKNTSDEVGGGREVTGFGSAFWPEPETWGLRGDPHLWRALRRRFDGAPVPMREGEAEVVLRYAIREIIGQELGTAAEAVRVPAFSIGTGMSDGHGSRDFWLDRGLPLLVARAAELARK
jgi:molybdenum cofactor cytidylyltransferase